MAHVLHTGQVEKLHLRIGGEGALAMTFDMVHWIAKQVLWFVCLFNFLLLLLFCVLKSCQMFLCIRVYVLGIISHKLFPPWLLKGCSDSNWNRLEISREAWSGECLGQGGGTHGLPGGCWGTWPSGSNSVQMSPKSHNSLLASSGFSALAWSTCFC